MACEKCGIDKLVKHGKRAFRDGKHQMYKCTGCSHIQTGELIEMNAEVK